MPPKEKALKSAVEGSGSGVTKHKKIKPVKLPEYLEKIFFGLPPSLITFTDKPLTINAIWKLLEDNYDGDYKTTTTIKKDLKKAVDKGAFMMPTKMTFWPTSRPLPVVFKPEVTITEVKIGQGPVVGIGDAVGIDYKLSLCSAPTKVVEKGKAFKFTVGEGDVVKGMDHGVRGMQLGGSRTITVPFQLGYGMRGSGPEVPPGSDLLFAITLSSLTPSTWVNYWMNTTSGSVEGSKGQDRTRWELGAPLHFYIYYYFLVFFVL